MPNQDSTQNPQSTPSGQVPDPTFNPVPSIEPSIVPDVQQSDLPDSTPVHTDLPPLPPDFQSIASEDSGSAAPSDLPPMIATPKKKFGSGKIIATILGIFLLVGGVGTGLLLTQQQQIFQPKAVTCNPGKHLCTCHAGSGCVDTSMTCDTYCGGSSSVVSDSANGDVNINDTSTSVCTSGKTLCKCKAGSGCIDPNQYSCATYCGGEENIVPITPPVSCSGNNATCTSDPDCCNGYTCSLTTKTCQGNSNTTDCGRNTDINAPVCCKENTTRASCIAGGGEPVCEGRRYECKTNGVWCTIDMTTCNTPTNPPKPTTPPTPGPTAVCQSVKAYSSIWAPLTSADLSALKAGSVVNFCVSGTASSGSFDKGRFTINGVQQAETTTSRRLSPDSLVAGEFCQNYTIPAGVTTFNVTAQIHHSSLGWK